MRQCKARPRGSTANPAAVDAMFAVKDDASTKVVTITCEKQKEGAKLELPLTFQGQTVEFKDPAGETQQSLLFTRTAGKIKDGVDDPRLRLALDIIAENKGKMPLSMNALADELARRYATEELTDGQLEKAKEAMRNFLRTEVKGALAPYAHKAGKAKNAPWIFEDGSGRHGR